MIRYEDALFRTQGEMHNVMCEKNALLLHQLLYKITYRIVVNVHNNHIIVVFNFIWYKKT